MAGFDELKRKAADALKDEEQTDRKLDQAADFLRDKTGGQHDDKIQKGRDFLDEKVGGESQDPNGDQSEGQNPNQG